MVPLPAMADHERVGDGATVDEVGVDGVLVGNGTLMRGGVIAPSFAGVVGGVVSGNCGVGFGAYCCLGRSVLGVAVLLLLCLYVCAG